MGAPATASTADIDLIALYQKGDERAAAELVYRHTAPLARFLSAQGAPDGELDDLVQEAFIRAFGAIAGYRGGASFRTWLLTIGSNLLRDRQRQWKKRQVVALAPDTVDAGADPAGEAEASATAERLKEGIGRLARLQREVFMLRAQQGFEYPAIAQALDITEGAARVHYHHAVKRLKAWIS